MFRLRIEGQLRQNGLKSFILCAHRFIVTFSIKCLFLNLNINSLSPVSCRASLSLSVAYRMNQSSSGSLQTELALAQSPLEVSTLMLCLIYSSFFYALYYCHFYLLSAAASLMYPSSVVLAWSLMFTLISLHNVFSISSFASDSEWTVVWWLVFSRVSHIIGTHCKATQTAVLTSDAAIHRAHT